jgi:predicted DCC family thiol-disulfide oxidoreductase YuxK
MATAIALFESSRRHGNTGQLLDHVAAELGMAADRLTIELQVTDIVIFDGVCNLCARSVQFILRHESEPRFQFSPVQSAAGARILGTHGISAADVDTFVLVSEGKVYTRSTAALRIARHFKGAWQLLRILWVVPRPLRDMLYNFVARNRYTWFGKAESCLVPTPELSARFIYD